MLTFGRCRMELDGSMWEWDFDLTLQIRTKQIRNFLFLQYCLTHRSTATDVNAWYAPTPFSSPSLLWPVEDQSTIQRAEWPQLRKRCAPYCNACEDQEKNSVSKERSIMYHVHVSNVLSDKWQNICPRGSRIGTNTFFVSLIGKFRCPNFATSRANFAKISLETFDFSLVP